MKTRVYKGKMSKSRPRSSSVRFRMLKILPKYKCQKNGKNQSNICNNEVLNLGGLELPVFGLGWARPNKDVLKLYVLTKY